MKITHRAGADASAPLLLTPLTQLLDAAGSTKAPRLSCCCRLSELLPLVRQLHDAARAAQLATEAKPGVAA
ncbi:hypothetical protein GO988_16620 [Hymenobacter sp. HMF4947]|uniref:Uncharacterized protein n=1 Tax=Hymenobacter ginkgonis TaxID=2682976 RepID=A0A7K1THR3_9BACT|nr:hypothetical protein [Hymenobacter ginkgonis]MVN77955.1 hypothetical protein [Hymenobacter ginkgonis]